MAENTQSPLQSRSFRHKVMYFIGIVVLMIPMFWISQPSTVGAGGEKGTPGGKLEQLRRESKISEADIGDVNLAGETIRLGMFGLDGVATLTLWQKADEYKKKKDWTNLSATLKQLILLVPHFETVWRFQGWNLAYNVSVEHDNYKDRYAWVIEGIRYLERGVRFNPRSIRVTWDVGWTTAQKISKSDEKVQFRQLFREDNDFNKDRPLEMRDSWLIGKEWYKRAENLHLKEGVDLQTISPTLFFSHAPNAQAYYSENLETDGQFEQKTLHAWETFSREWLEYGNREHPSATGSLLRLEDEERYAELGEKLRAELESLQPGLYQSMVDAKRAKLTEEERSAMDKPLEERTADEHNLGSEAAEKTRVSNTEWATALPTDLRTRGLDLAKRLDEATEQEKLIRRYRMIVNYKFWRLRGQLERTPEIVEARRLVYEADRAYANGDLVVAKNNYDTALNIWNGMIRTPQFEEIIDEEMLGTDLRELIDKYEIILDQRNETLPANFPLKEVISKTSPTDPALLQDMRREKPSMPVVQ
ncbi:MAG: hypothetical protein Q4D98_02525 [Planctomycetia bacterium]|nr:hypothetical protein [Planctomycetia bacterium]